jgi:hypothetical protein
VLSSIGTRESWEKDLIAGDAELFYLVQNEGEFQVGACHHELTPGEDDVQVIDDGCAVDRFLFPGTAQFTARALAGGTCPPQNRVRAFINAYGPRDACSAVAQITQALGHA